MEPTQIGENVVLVNGIIGYGCRVFYSCIAVKFVMGSHSNLKYGARLIDSYLGDNSTISCCEVLNTTPSPSNEASPLWGGREGGLPRGLRNNNPLNIRHSKDKWKGRRKSLLLPGRNSHSS